jgi:hypothetical protein
MTLLIPDARRALLGGVIDFAGLFPPASLDASTAVETFRRIRASADGWMAGRLLCPASRLDDLAAALVAGIRRSEEPWRIGVTCDGDVGSCASMGRGFHLEMDPAVTVEIAETSILPGAAAEVVHETLIALCGINDRIVPYLEVDAVHGGEADMVDGIYSIAAARDLARRRGGAKLRCAGFTDSHVPSPRRVAAFIDAATRAEIPFTFTAGLNHAFRESDAATGTVHHGFMNLFAAAAVARAGGRLDEIEDAVADTDPTRFKVSFAGLRWGDHEIGGADLGALRAEGLTSFSSSDFDDPVAALRARGLVP